MGRIDRLYNGYDGDGCYKEDRMLAVAPQVIFTLIALGVASVCAWGIYTTRMDSASTLLTADKGMPRCLGS